MKAQRTPAQQDLLNLMSHVYGNDDLPEPTSATINGMQFTVSYHRVNRECYDNLPTPTVQFKVNGKRIARKAAFELLA